MQIVSNNIRACVPSTRRKRRVALLLVSVLCGAGAVPSAAGAAEYAKAVSGQLNPSGKVVNIPVPFSAVGQELGDIVVSINPDDSVAVAKSVLLD